MKQLLLCLSVFAFNILLAQNTETPTPQWRPVYHFTPEKKLDE